MEHPGPTSAGGPPDKLPPYGEALALLVHRFWVPTALGAILLLAAVVRIYDIGGNPPGFFADEASYGYNAYSILDTGKDEHGARLPIFFRAFGEYKLPVYTYSQIPFIIVFGLSELAVRLTTATYGILTVLAVYLLIRALFHQQALALAAAAILAILPWHIFYSRTGLGEIIVFPFFLTLGLYLFILGTRRPLYWLAAALVFGLTLYSYRSAWVTVPPLLLVLAVLYRRELIEHWRISLACLFILAAACVPIATHQILSVDTDRAQEQSILNLDLSPLETVKRFSSHYRSHFETSFLFEGGAGGNLRHVVPGWGWLYWWQLPFIILGAVALLWKPSRPKLLVLALLLIFPLGAAVTRGSPSSNRSILGAVAFSMITAYGIVTAARVLGGWRWPRGLKAVGVGLAGVVVLGTTITASIRLASYLDTYHGEYQRISAGYWGWQWGARAIIEHFVAVEDEYDQLVMEGAFNVAEIFPPFYAPNDCGKCIIGKWDKYDPTKKQLFALRPETMPYNYEYDVKGTLYYPNGEPAFLFVEITKSDGSLRGNLSPRSQGDPRRSIADLDRVIESEPGLASAYIDRAVAYLNLGDVELAKRDLSRAIELDPTLALAFYNMGNALSMWRYDYALEEYRKATRLDASLAEAYNNIGNLYNQGAPDERAIAELDTAIALDPDLAMAYANRGIAYSGQGLAAADQGKVAQGIADLSKAIELEPDLAFAYAERGRVYAKLGELTFAMADLDKAIALDSRYAEAYDSRGFVYAQLGEWQRAVADHDKAIALDRDYARAYAHRGIAYLNLGDTDQALADLDKAVELDHVYTLTVGHRRNEDWNLGDVEQAVGDLREAISRTSDPAVIARLEEIVDYLVRG